MPYGRRGVLAVGQRQRAIADFKTRVVLSSGPFSLRRQFLSSSGPRADGQRGHEKFATLALVGVGLGAVGFGYAYFDKNRKDEKPWASVGRQVDQVTSWVQKRFSPVTTAQCEPGKPGPDSDCERCEDSACLRRMDKEEEIIEKANRDLETALKDVKPKAVEYTEAALKAYCDASDAIKQFIDAAYCAIEQDGMESPRFEEVWCEVYDLALKRCQKVNEAISKGQCAWELLCRLREVIENGKNCKYTQCNPLLVTAEEALLCAERELLNAKSRMDCIQSESRLVEQYRNIVEDFRRDLKAEVESLVPGDCKMSLTENECVMMVTHAYKKVLRIQKELAQAQGEQQ